MKRLGFRSVSKSIEKRARKTLEHSALVRNLAARSRDLARAATAASEALFGTEKSRAATAPARAFHSLTGAASREGTRNRALAVHVGKLADKRARRLFECRHFWSTEDPVEALHDLRVSSRRLLALCNVFGEFLDEDLHERSTKRLRRVTRAVRELRDEDVQLELLAKRLAASHDDKERAALEYLLEHFDRKRERTVRDAKRKLRRVDFDALAGSIGAALGDIVLRLPTPGAETSRFVLDSLEPLVREAEHDAPPNDGPEDAEALHELRLDLKRLRYAIELLGPCLGTGYAALYERAESTQELLGTHHDLVVMGELLDEQARDLEKRSRAVLGAGVRSLQETLARERRELLVQFRNDGFDAAWWRAALENAVQSSSAAEAAPPSEAP
jgi:CHAD domain-containing protein